MDDKHQERSEDGHSAEYSRPQHNPDPEGIFARKYGRNKVFE